MLVIHLAEGRGSKDKWADFRKGTSRSGQVVMDLTTSVLAAVCSREPARASISCNREGLLVLQEEPAQLQVHLCKPR